MNIQFDQSDKKINLNSSIFKGFSSCLLPGLELNLLDLLSYLYFPEFEASILSTSTLLVSHFSFSAVFLIARIRLKFLDLKTFLIK